jgi:hypothetical protein
MRSIHTILEELMRERFYGSMEIKFEAGKAELFRKTETIRPTDSDYRENRGDSNERHSDVSR